MLEMIVIFGLVFGFFAFLGIIEKFIDKTL